MNQVEFVKKNYKRLGPVATAQALGVNTSTVWGIAQRCGASKSRGGYRESTLREEMRMMLPELCQTMSNAEIAEMFGVTIQIVKHDLHAMEVKRKDPWSEFDAAIHSAIMKAEMTNEFPIRVMRREYPETMEKLLATFSRNALNKRIQRKSKVIRSERKVN